VDPFQRFHWSFKIHTNLLNPITILTISSLNKTLKKKFRSPNPAISLAITIFLHTHKAYSTPIYMLTRGVSRCDLAVYNLKKYLKAKEELWKIK
jgi:hypothetical protein